MPMPANIRLDNKMKTAIIGSGNVAWHLTHAFEGNSSVETVSVNPRTLEGLPADADLYVVAISDDAIPGMAAKLKNLIPQATVAHTSGSTPLSVLQNHFDNSAVIYPLQTFSKDDIIKYDEIPFFLEATSPKALEAAECFAKSVSDRVYSADSEVRKTIHLAAVFACNFTNRMIGIAGELLQTKGLPADVVIPLVEQTVSKLRRISAAEAQTGPAARNDTRIMEFQSQSLSDYPEIREIYDMISKSIMRKSLKIENQ